MGFLFLLAAFPLGIILALVADAHEEAHRRRVAERHRKRKKEFKALFDEMTFDMDNDNRCLKVLRERCDYLVYNYSDRLEQRFKEMLDSEVRTRVDDAVEAAVRDAYKRLDTIEEKTAYIKELEDICLDVQLARQLSEKLDAKLLELRDIEMKLEHMSAFYDMMDADGFWAPFKAPARRGRPSSKNRS